MDASEAPCEPFELESSPVIISGSFCRGGHRSLVFSGALVEMSARRGGQAESLSFCLAKCFFRSSTKKPHPDRTRYKTKGIAVASIPQVAFEEHGVLHLMNL